MKGVISSTGVVAIDVETEPMPVRYFVVDPNRTDFVPFEGGLVSFVGSVEDAVKSYGDSQTTSIF